MSDYPVRNRKLVLYVRRRRYVDEDDKSFLGGYPEWEDREHASEWVLLEQNIGEKLRIDETKLGDDVYTILSNKAGHGGHGALLVVVRGTKAEHVASVINKRKE